MMYNPSVASSEMTMLRKIEFVKSEFGVRGPSVLMMLSMPLNARKNAETCSFHRLHNISPALVTITAALRSLEGRTVM